MKISRFLIMLGIVSFLGGQSLFAQDKQEEKKQKVKDLIESGTYRVDIDRAYPMGGRSVNLTSLYSIDIKGDSIYSHLPYYGRAYSVPYGGGNGMRFEKPVMDYNVSFDKDDKATVVFSSRSDDDKYEFRIQIYSNGTATVFVQPTNKQSITYHGEIRLKQE